MLPWWWGVIMKETSARLRCCNREIRNRLKFYETFIVIRVSLFGFALVPCSLCHAVNPEGASGGAAQRIGRMCDESQIVTCVSVCRMGLRDNFIFRWFRGSMRKTSWKSLNNACESGSFADNSIYWSPPGELKWIWWFRKFDYFNQTPIWLTPGWATKEFDAVKQISELFMPKSHSNSEIFKWQLKGRTFMMNYILKLFWKIA